MRLIDLVDAVDPRHDRLGKLLEPAVGHSSAQGQQPRLELATQPLEKKVGAFAQTALGDFADFRRRQGGR